MDAVKILGNLLGSNAMSSGLGSQIVGGLLKSAMGGSDSGAGGGLGGLIGSVLGGGGASSGGGGLGGLIGSALGGGQASGGGLGSLLSGALGGGAGAAGGGALGGLLMNALQQFGQTQAGGQAAQQMPQPVPENQFTAEQRQQANDEALVLIKAMISAAKADGHVDQDEQQRILQQLGDISQDEMDFVRQELAQPVDLDGLVHNVPAGLEAQTYFISLMTIKLDTQQEARYMQQLAQGMGLPVEACREIHDKLGAPQIYS